MNMFKLKHMTVKFIQTFSDQCLDDVFINKSEMENESESSFISTFHLVHVILLNVVFKLNDICFAAGKEIPRMNLHIPSRCTIQLIHAFL
jgi:aspartate ammonia-lyase